jgi:phosphate transport system substrate-binding protein
MRTGNNYRRSAVIVLALTAVLTGCSSPDQVAEGKAPAGAVVVKGAGATLPFPLYKEWFAAYQSGHPGTVVTYDSVGSGEGIRRFLGKNVKPEERVDFGASDATMRDEEIAPSNGVLLLPMTAGAVVLAYNLPNFEGDLKLSRNALAGIFLGEIRNWNDRQIAEANPGSKLPKLTIATVVRQDGSGTTFAFTKHLDAISDRWRSQYGPETLVNWPGNAMRASGNEGVAGRINQSSGSIAYVSYEFARKLKLRIAALENRSGHFVAPNGRSSEAALACAELPDNPRLFVSDPPGASAYPIVTFSWILLYPTYTDAKRAKIVRELFRWCLSEGQNYASQLGYVKLPPSLAARSLTVLESVKPKH